MMQGSSTNVDIMLDSEMFAKSENKLAEMKTPVSVTVVLRFGLFGQSLVKVAEFEISLKEMALSELKP